jgi:hypothetical protein
LPAGEPISSQLHLNEPLGVQGEPAAGVDEHDKVLSFDCPAWAVRMI